MAALGVARPIPLIVSSGVSAPSQSAAKHLLKRTARGRSTASVAAGEARGREPGGVEGEERPVPQGGADDAVPVPASRAGEGAHGGGGEPSRASHSGPERDILHQGQVWDS